MMVNFGMDGYTKTPNQRKTIEKNAQRLHNTKNY